MLYISKYLYIFLATWHVVPQTGVCSGNGLNHKITREVPIEFFKM